MSYAVEPVFVIIPLVCFFIQFTNLQKKKSVFFLLTVAFILIYSFSLNGSDISGYYAHYKMVERGESLANNAQEIGYYYLMKGAVSLGLDYVSFRILLLSSLTLAMFHTIRNFAKDFALSLFFISSMFIIYTISAYRQYIVIAFSLYWIYHYCHGKEKIAIAGMATLLLFHVTAILPLACMVFSSIQRRRKIEKNVDKFKKYFLIILISALFCRVMITFLLQTSFFNALTSGVLGDHASANPTLFSFGLVSRTVFLIVITYYFRVSKTLNSSIKFLYWYYFVSIMFYIAIPLEFVMGRLMNNANILCAVLIPMLKREFKEGLFSLLYGYNKRKVNALLFMLEIVAFAILINQLVNQDGYTPYMNLLLGDKFAENFTW